MPSAYRGDVSPAPETGSPAGSRHLAGEPAVLAGIARRFTQFADAYPQLGLYRRLCRAAAGDERICRMLLAAPDPGQRRPVLLLAALHDLVLRQGTAVPAARWYASVTGRAGLPAPREWDEPGAGPWPDVRATLLAHADEITATIASRTMTTNEANRAGYVLPMLALATAELPARPVVLAEAGCSAGLLLACDQYDVRVSAAGTSTGTESAHPGHAPDSPAGKDPGGRAVTPPEPALSWGDPSSPVQVRTEDRTCAGDVPLAARGIVPPLVAARAGVDLSVTSLDDEESLRWLTACLWPDVPGRVERFRAAVGQRRAQAAAGIAPVSLLTGDAAEPGVLARAIRPAVAAATAATGQAPHVVVLTSWTVTYIERSRRVRLGEQIAALAAGGLPVTWCSAEAAGTVPGLPPVPDPLPAPARTGTTVLAARRWRDGTESTPRIWGVADAHASWVRFAPP